jgi:hypothetical protein
LEGIIVLPKVTENLTQARRELGAVDASIGTDCDQTKGMSLLILDHEQAPVRQLQDSRRLIDTGQRPKAGASWCVMQALSTSVRVLRSV